MNPHALICTSCFLSLLRFVVSATKSQGRGQLSWSGQRGRAVSWPVLLRLSRWGFAGSELSMAQRAVMELSGCYCRREEAPPLSLSPLFCQRQEFTAAADLELLVFRPPLPKHWDYNCRLILPVYVVLGLCALGKPSTNPATGPAGKKSFPWEHHGISLASSPWATNTRREEAAKLTLFPEAWDPGSS